MKQLVVFEKMYGTSANQAKQNFERINQVKPTRTWQYNFYGDREILAEYETEQELSVGFLRYNTTIVGNGLTFEEQKELTKTFLK